MGTAASISLDGGDEATSYLGKRLTHGCNLFIQDEIARRAYVNFLRRGHWIKQYTEQPKNDNALVTITSVADEKNQPVDTYNGYSLPTDIPAVQVQGMLEPKVREEDGPVQAVVIESCFSESQLRIVLLASLFPVFLQSPEYFQYVKGEMQRPIALNPHHLHHRQEQPPELQLKSDNLLLEAVERDQRLATLGSAFHSTTQPMEAMAAQAMGSVDAEELTHLLQEGDWLRGVLTAVEDLPLCVTLASARDDRRGFPLVYVNKAFEAVSLYNRKEVVGRNCRFLQSPASQPQQVQRLTDALRLALPVKVALTNVRKDGSEFTNLLAMKPVFDSEGVYSYVIGVQCDISSNNKGDPHAANAQLASVDDVLALLPNILN